MVRCKECKDIISLSSEDILNGYMQESLKLVHTKSEKLGLCIECYRKVKERSND